MLTASTARTYMAEAPMWTASRHGWWLDNNSTDGCESERWCPHRLLLGCEERGRGGDAAGQVVERGLAQNAAAARVVQHIIYQLRTQQHELRQQCLLALQYPFHSNSWWGCAHPLPGHEEQM
jgi:hypothetical protein